MSELEIALKAVELYASQHPRPSHVNQKQAGEMLGLSAPTIKKMIAAGNLKLNTCGLIPIAELQRYQYKKKSPKSESATIADEAQTTNGKRLVAMLLAATEVTNDPGVYFFTQGEEVIYVGMSKTSVKSRVAGRSRLVQSVRMIKTNPEQAEKLEMEFIRFLRPSGNVQGKCF